MIAPTASSQAAASYQYMTADPRSGPIETLLPSDVAARLGVSESCLAKWRMVGKGPPFVRVSHRRVVYLVPAFNEFIASRTRATTRDATFAGGT